MAESSEFYHARRAAAERAMADRAGDAQGARAHRELARLHDELAGRYIIHEESQFV